jgi:predicted outer membrane protein
LVATTAVAIAARPQQREGNAPFAQQQRDQNQLQNQNQTIDRTGANRGMAGRHDLDHFFVKLLIQANKDEIEMGKVAEQRSSNPDVKQLATQMVQDHTRFLNQLEQFKGMRGNPQAGEQPETQRGTAYRGPTPDGQPQQQDLSQQPGQQPGPGNIRQRGLGGRLGMRQPGMAERGDQMMGEHGPGHEFAKIMESVDRSTQQAMIRELNSKQGADFDRCYLGCQLFGHMWVAEALKAFEMQASPQLKPILQEGLQTTEQHLTHIKSVLARIDNEPRTGARVQQPGRFQPRGRFNQ